jgi:hypothetical protein
LRGVGHIGIREIEGRRREAQGYVRAALVDHVRLIQPHILLLQHASL